MIINAPLCWRNRLQMQAKEGWAEQVTVPSPQMAPCLPPVINRRWLPAVITVFKQLGPAWSNALTAWALRAQALGFAGFGISAETSMIQDNWKPMLLSVFSCLVLRGCMCWWFESSWQFSQKKDQAVMLALLPVTVEGPPAAAYVHSDALELPAKDSASTDSGSKSTSLFDIRAN